MFPGQSFLQSGGTSEAGDEDGERRVQQRPTDPPFAKCSRTLIRMLSHFNFLAAAGWPRPHFAADPPFNFLAAARSPRPHQRACARADFRSVRSLCRWSTLASQPVRLARHPQPVLVPGPTPSLQRGPFHSVAARRRVAHSVSPVVLATRRVESILERCTYAARKSSQTAVA